MQCSILCASQVSVQAHVRWYFYCFLQTFDIRFMPAADATAQARGPNVARLNPRPDRGGLVQPPPPLRFFAVSEKTAPPFWSTLWGKPCATFGKKKLTKSGQVTEL